MGPADECHRLTKYPQDENGYADLGAALHAMGRNREAMDPLQEAEVLNPATCRCKTILVPCWDLWAISIRLSLTFAKRSN